MTPTSAAFIERLDRVQERLREQLSSTVADTGLTEPDGETGERWEAGQVWSHILEFIPYWMQQADLVLAAPEEGDPPAFGRTKRDTDRLRAVEAGLEGVPPDAVEALARHVEELREWLSRRTDADWSRIGRHPSLGEMGMPRIVDEFLVGHIEEHESQLESAEP